MSWRDSLVRRVIEANEISTKKQKHEHTNKDQTQESKEQRRTGEHCLVRNPGRQPRASTDLLWQIIRLENREVPGAKALLAHRYRRRRCDARWRNDGAAVSGAQRHELPGRALGRRGSGQGRKTRRQNL